MLVKQPQVRVTMFVDVAPEDVYTAFTEPDWLCGFWLAQADGPLRVGQAVKWTFMVTGAEATVTARRMVPSHQIIWDWDDGSTVQIDLDPFEDGTAVTLLSWGFAGSDDEQMAAALDATEAYSIVLCDLKTLMESGKSAGLTRAKAQLIEARQ
ncbi:SRPBCC domain-containing protein [Cypionkella sp.]|uniref:SRPBCC domain-containing protein n=1 Tax=Cypionkella sp. TaxID=2811411 RepID=UPI002631DF39|nr:SRPBCC domain-containing protein [Cypionkella sp.]MDB5663633.1 hypothetical protein [Cypionkella sp.]